MIRNWFTRRRERLFAEYLRQIEEKRKVEEAAEIKRQEDLRIAALTVQQEQETARKESDEPWMRMISDKVVDGVAKVELDWNPAMIDYLRQHGFTGDENQVIQRYLGALCREMYEDGKNDALDILKQFPDEKMQEAFPAKLE